jgi:hypothetical protein
VNRWSASHCKWGFGFFFLFFKKKKLRENKK